MYQTKTLYTVMWDNAESWEDYDCGIWCVCPTAEKAQEVVKFLTEQKAKDYRLIHELCKKDERQKAKEIESFWSSKIHYFYLDKVYFRIGTVDYIE